MTWISPDNTTIHNILNAIKFNEDGLLTAIAQDIHGHILMLAWMNKDSLMETLQTGRVCYFSRSRQQLWRKGETSGQEQYLLKASLDCDGDALLLTVSQKGVACHTGRRSCFYQDITPTGLVENSKPQISPQSLYQK